ncbi:hypothetical protein LGL55_23015 [Clostridium tagluense]|uniref:hypothetical protein n=1 Tax=Clostridium TaxID=1485 RepID=UPI0013E9164B|nr:MULTISPECIES: hypothetical protein [Clostridium]MBU3130196.1 hypothetical protein [Clostridium tagluense]MBZ9626077.1 hypothetical protein [Clostridium sp. FP2]MCB2313658.1 hypothetical protein [Clostridium tagluense]MCB2318786.1 hypothetical protein [Clostridium tagluense]MCB2323636.1 hypothetical protein [Clostridium tagluense]
MFLNVLVIILIIFTIVNLIIGLYYFSKQEYNRFSVSLLLKRDTLNLIKSKGINQKNYKKIKFILNIRTILIIIIGLPSIILIYTVFKPANMPITYSIFILILIIQFISNKLIKNLL